LWDVIAFRHKTKTFSFTPQQMSKPEPFVIFALSKMPGYFWLIESIFHDELVKTVRPFCHYHDRGENVMLLKSSFSQKFLGVPILLHRCSFLL
jgi:hypothetical protein